MDIPQTTTTRWHTLFAWSALILSILLYPILLVRYAGATSPTFDEGMHIAAGYRYWQCGDYGINPEHPPLLKLVAAATVRRWPLEVFDSPCGSATINNAHLIAVGYRLLNSELGHAALLEARYAAMLFTLSLLLTIFLAARTWFGPLAAGIAVLLTVFEPNLTGHGALVTTDMAIAATTLLAVFSADRYLRNPSLLRLFFLGLALGAALASKHTGIFVPLILALEFASNRWFEPSGSSRQNLLRLWAAFLGACVVALAVLWATYQFRYSALPGHANGFDIAQTLQTDNRASTPFGHAIRTVARFHLLPESYLAGLLYVVDNSTRTSFIFGHEHATGVWYYFPVTMLVKTPLSLLVLFLLGTVSPGLWKSRSRELVILSLPIAVFLLSAMTSKINLGVRHILPVYPFMILFAAAAAAYYSQRSKLWLAVSAALLVFQWVSYAHSFPNQIAYANQAWGGPVNVRLYLGDSNVDWGQSLYQVRDYINRRGIGDCWIAWLGGENPDHAGLPCKQLASPSFIEAAQPDLPGLLPERFSGTLFISNTLTNYSIFPYNWFLTHQPDDVIAGSVLVFHGDFRLPEIAAERHVSRGWWFLNHQQPAQAAEEFAAAEPHVAFPGILHGLYGWALEASGKPAEARAKYAQAADDLAGMPSYEAARAANLARVHALSQSR
jgi:hypothetical protein